MNFYALKNGKILLLMKNDAINVEKNRIKLVSLNKTKKKLKKKQQIIKNSLKFKINHVIIYLQDNLKDKLYKF